MGIDPISIGLMVAGTLVSAGGQIMGQQAADKARKAQQRQADMEAQRKKLEQVRQARIARANIIQAGENQGAGGSSAVQGGAMGVTAQANQNIQYVGDQQNINNAISHAQTQEANAAGLSNLGAGIASFGGTVFNHSDYIKQKASSVFG